MTGAFDRVMIVVLLGCVGLTAGLAFGTLFAGNQSARSLFPGHGPTRNLGVTFVLPPKSSYTFPARFSPAPELVKLTREAHHPGVRAVAHGERVIVLSPKPLGHWGRSFVCMEHRRYCDDYTAHWLALRKAALLYVMGAGTGRTFKLTWHGTDTPGCGLQTCGGTAWLSGASYVVRRPIGGYVVFGMLAGLSAAVGFLVPSGSRVNPLRRFS
ncbi:MAG: hypothetical protein ACTHKL_10015 [Streptosporangiaceae bacterium]